MPASQSKLAQLTPNLGILWISVCSFWPCESIVANPIIYRLVPSPSRYEIRQCQTILLVKGRPLGSERLKHLISSLTTANQIFMDFVKSAGKEDPVELDSSLTLWKDMRCRICTCRSTASCATKYHYSFHFLWTMIKKFSMYHNPLQICCTNNWNSIIVRWKCAVQTVHNTFVYYTSKS